MKAVRAEQARHALRRILPRPTAPLMRPVNENARKRRRMLP